MKNERTLLWLSGGGLITFFIAIYLLTPYYQQDIIDFTVAHPVLAPFILILWRFIGVVIPPIPAGLVAFALLPVLGWFWVFLYSSIGLLLGAIVAFWLARIFREPLVKRFVPLKDLSKWESKLSEKTELWGFILVRMTTGPVMDFISYLAGITKLPFWKFFVATVISLIPSATAYYLGQTAYDKVSTESPFIAIGFLLSLGVVYLFYKDQMRQKKKKNES